MRDATTLQSRETRAYLLLAALVICGLVASVITAPKVVDFGVHCPFSTIIFSICSYPIVDCICELWGKRVARQTLWLALFCQFLFTMLVQLSILAPAAQFWKLQAEYEAVLSVGGNVIIASLIAFTLSQILDIAVYQRIKELSHGKMLWLRSNISIYLGQALDSFIFILIVFHDSDRKFHLFFGAVLVKIVLALLMTPVIYLIVMAVNRYLGNNTLAFRDEALSPQLQPRL